MCMWLYIYKSFRLLIFAFFIFEVILWQPFTKLIKFDSYVDGRMMNI